VEVSAWHNGAGTYGVRIGKPNREQLFNKSWESIEVDVDGCLCQFQLTSRFWENCPEFRDSGSTIIRDWLNTYHSTNWPRGNPPRFKLIPLGGQRFRLMP